MWEDYCPSMPYWCGFLDASGCSLCHTRCYIRWPFSSLSQHGSSYVHLVLQGWPYVMNSEELNITLSTSYLPLIFTNHYNHLLSRLRPVFMAFLWHSACCSWFLCVFIAFAQLQFNPSPRLQSIEDFCSDGCAASYLFDEWNSMCIKSVVPVSQQSYLDVQLFSDVAQPFAHLEHLVVVNEQTIEEKTTEQ